MSLDTLWDKQPTLARPTEPHDPNEIGRASCRERV